MSQDKRKYDSTVARIAGNIASGLAKEIPDPARSPSSYADAIWRITQTSVHLARTIVEEVERTEPAPTATVTPTAPLTHCPYPIVAGGDLVPYADCPIHGIARNIQRSYTSPPAGEHGR